MNKKISLDLLKINLTPQEMRNVMGGSCYTCDVKCDKLIDPVGINCVDIEECCEKAYVLCGDSGWMWNCPEQF